MSDVDHYREAERLLAGAQNVNEIAPVDGLTRRECVEMAKVHAVLAVVGAIYELVNRTGGP